MLIHPSRVRSVESVEAGIKMDVEDGRVRIVHYEPGNGSRYILMFTALSGLDEAQFNLGCGNESVVVTRIEDPSRYGVCIFNRGGYIEPWRLLEKGLVKQSQNDAFALTELIAHVLEADAPSLEEMCASAG